MSKDKQVSELRDLQSVQAQLNEALGFIDCGKILDGKKTLRVAIANLDIVVFEKTKEIAP